MGTFLGHRPCIKKGIERISARRRQYYNSRAYFSFF